jgi:hypothetical protein
MEAAVAMAVRTAVADLMSKAEVIMGVATKLTCNLCNFQGTLCQKLQMGMRRDKLLPNQRVETWMKKWGMIWRWLHAGLPVMKWRKHSKLNMTANWLKMMLRVPCKRMGLHQAVTMGMDHRLQVGMDLMRSPPRKQLT